MTEHGYRTCCGVGRVGNAANLRGRDSIILERVASSRDRPCQVPELLVFRVHESARASPRGVESESPHLLTAAPDRRDIVHNVQPRFFGKLPVVFGEHAVQLGDLFMDTKAFCNHLLYSTRCNRH